MNKKIVLIKIIENIILGFIKFYIIAITMLAANIDDYLIPPSFLEKFLIVSIGLVIVIVLDFGINFILYKFLRKNNEITYKSLIKPSLVITIVNFIYILFS